MIIGAICKYGTGDRELPPIMDALIFTETEAIQRGALGADGIYENAKNRPRYTLRFPYPTNGELIRAGEYIMVSCPELGLVNQALYILGVTKRKGVWIEMTGESYIGVD